MGLAEHIKAGARLIRDVVTITDTQGSGSVAIGATYAVLSIQSDNITPVRFRLYDTENSMLDAGEINRVFGDTNISASVTLVGDFSMSAAGVYSIDPVLFGHTQTKINPLSYYRMEPSGSQLKINRYLLEDVAVTDEVDNRRHLPIIAASLAPGNIASGSIVSVEIPTTYLLVSASLKNTTHIARLRLYSYSSGSYDATEKTRVFSTEPSASVRLIADMVISGSQNLSLSPKIIGSNLQNLGNSLNDIRKSKELIQGEQELYYIIENVNTTGGTVPISASLYVYALEG